MRDQSIFIVGAAGEGIQTIGDVVARALLQSGVHVFATKEYESRIRGGNSSYRLRVGGINAPRHDADIILSLNPTAATHYASAASPHCIMLGEHSSEVRGTQIAFHSLAKETFGSSIYANAIAAGSLGSLLGISPAILESAIRERFAKLPADIQQRNIDALSLGRKEVAHVSDMVVEIGNGQLSDGTSYASVHEAIPLAAAAAGCRFMAAYPMSPATGIMTAFAKDPELGVFVEQVEDEIAAINMCLGASAAGARAMTATSGGGFALMTEGLSLAGMTETPLVIVVAQRPGPATGLPTRTAQEDLNFAIYGGHGEFPRAVLAPSDPQDAVRQAFRAFDLAERYQMPVILLTDQLLADSHFSQPMLNVPDVPVPTGLAAPEEFENYERYALTENGVSPRLALGQSPHLVLIDSDEHTEEGHITEDLAFTRPAMVEKRLEKARRVKNEMPRPAPYRMEDATHVLISWGSTRFAVAEAIDTLRERGESVGGLHFSAVWPIPSMLWEPGIEYWSVESNAAGQFGTLIQTETGIPLAGKIERYDGIPLDAKTIVSAWQNGSTGEAT